MPEIFCRAEASQSGLPQISAPRRSAEYSRVRLIAICTSIAASGATIIATSTPIKPNGLLLFSRLPPKKKAKLPSMEMAPASVAVIVMVSVSRFCTCASSCAMTPATSSGVKRSSNPVEAATAAFCGFRPVAKALGCALS
ncbi:hypothetical protein D3C86_1597090 [compost metagenome]